MLYFQTTNLHKFREAEEILARFGIKIKRIRAPYLEVQADKPEQVVREALKQIGRDGVFIEDVAISILSLWGFPGVYSRYCFETIGLAGILKLLKGATDRRAKFVSVIGLRENGEVKIFKGEVRGSISSEPRGSGGFGYDPIFVPEGHNKTFAEDMKLKNSVSHRTRALKKLARHIMKG